MHAITYSAFTPIGHVRPLKKKGRSTNEEMCLFTFNINCKDMLSTATNMLVDIAVSNDYSYTILWTLPNSVPASVDN